MGGERRRSGRWRGPWWVRGDVVGGVRGELPQLRVWQEAVQAAAIHDDGVAEFVPECPVEMAGHDAEVQADIGDDGADRTAADFGGDFSFGGEAREARVLGGIGGLVLGLCVRRRDLAFGARFACGRHADGRGREVLAARGALAQLGLQGRGEAQAVGDAGEDDGEVGAADAFGEEDDIRGGGALLDRGGKFLAEVDQPADDAEDAAEGGGHGWGGPGWIGFDGRGRGVGGGGHERI
jgi:hypothetical protein